MASRISGTTRGLRHLVQSDGSHQLSGNSTDILNINVSDCTWHLHCHHKSFVVQYSSLVLERW